MAYTGVSIVDFLASTGQPTDYASRAQLAASKGIQGYSGSAQQNTQLLNMLRGGATGAPIAQPPGVTAAPQAAKPQSSGYSGGGDTELSQLARTDRNPIQETRYKELLAQAGVGYFQGGNNTSAEDFMAHASGGGTGSGTGGGTGVSFNQPTINLPQIYESLYASSGIKDIEAELSAKTNAYNEQVGKIKDNPYLSEATMTGRLSKLKDKFNDDATLIQNNIAMKKADVEMKLNLQTKQFDIESQQAQQAWDQFNTLLSSGALDNASGEDIANITRSTGISSNMIRSAIGVSKAKNAPKLNTQVIQVDDGNEVSAVVINQDTGEVINRQVIGASTPTAAEVKAEIGGGGGGSGGSVKVTKAQETEQNRANLTKSIKNGVNLKALVKAFSGALTIDEIYRLYNLNSPFGKAKETLAQVKQGKFITS